MTKAARSCLKIDEQFRSQLFTLSAVELAQLEQSIIADGCREPLVVWNGVILDGHNRFDICTRNDIAFDTIEISLTDRDAAIDWIDRNQIGRRNLMPDEFAIISGRIYNRRKRQGARNDITSPQIDEKLTTSELVALELGTSKATIERNGQRAEVFDDMLAIGDVQAADAAKSLPQRFIAAAPSMPTEQAATELKKQVHVTANSGRQDWYTPVEVLDAARAVLGEFDVDPASSHIAQTLVQAKNYFTTEDDGLRQTWTGRVWLNPPYANGVIDSFAKKLLDEIDAGNATTAIVLVNNATETRWFQSLLNRCNGICLARSRIKFLDTNLQPKNTPLQGQAFFYFGDCIDVFSRAFSSTGVCLKVINDG